MATYLITKAEIERRIGAGTLAELTNDQGGLTADDTVVDEAREEASDRAMGILWRAFPSEAQIVNLAAADRAVKGAVIQICCGILGQRRAGLQSPEGKTPWAGWEAAGEKVLKEIADGKRRAKGEAAAGQNETLKTRINQPSPPRTTIFASTKDDPVGPGGF